MKSKGGAISYSDITKKHSQIDPNMRHKNFDLELNSDKNGNSSKENKCTQHATEKNVTSTNGNKMDGMTINDENGNTDKTIKSADLSMFKINIQIRGSQSKINSFCYI